MSSTWTVDSSQCPVFLHTRRITDPDAVVSGYDGYTSICMSESRERGRVRVRVMMATLASA